MTVGVQELKQPPYLSIVVPLYNEADNIRLLYDNVMEAMRDLGQPFELILVDDGSTDETGSEIEVLAGGDPRVKVIRLIVNQGQTSALMAGFFFSKGEVVVSMDGDMQNNPADIPRLLEKLNEGYDMVTGWRRRRDDAFFSRVLPSKIANWMIGRVLKIDVHDAGCTLKAYRRQTVDLIRLYGEMHRFIAVHALWSGARIAEIEVDHQPRRKGLSKYGWERVYKVVLDLMLLSFLGQYRTRPLYFFGSIGLLSILGGFAVFAFALYLRFFSDISLIQTPLPLLSTFCLLTGIVCILMGFLAEMLVRVYHESQGKPIFTVRKTINIDES
jgi:glycosyltransferase involved in cell wall biosynthesis